MSVTDGRAKSFERRAKMFSAVGQSHAAIIHNADSFTPSTAAELKLFTNFSDFNRVLTTIPSHNRIDRRVA